MHERVLITLLLYTADDIRDDQINVFKMQHDFLETFVNMFFKM